MIGSIRTKSKDSKRTRKTVLVGLAMVPLLASAACTGSADDGKDITTEGQNTSVKVVPHQGGSITMARAVEPSTLDPTLGRTDPGSIQAQIQIFDQLTEILPGKTDVSPGLAKSWEISEDGKTYEFKLRPAKFSDGTDLTSRDVEFTFNRLLDPEADPGFADFFNSFISSVRTTGTDTVEFTLKKRTPAFLSYLSFSTPSIVPATYYKKVGPAGFAKAPIGSGAFTLGSFKTGQSLVLKKNPHYWREGLPYLDEVTMNFLPDDNARLLAYRSESAQIADGVPFAQLKSVRRLPKTELLVKQISAVDMVLLNEKTVPALKDKNVRLALNHAVPREDIARTVFAGAAPIANAMTPPVKYGDKKVEPFKFDLKKAKKLMAQSTAPDGFTARYTYVAGDVAAKNVGTILKENWAKLGVRLNVRPAEFATASDQFFTGDYDMLAFQPTTLSSDVPIDDELALFFLSPLYKGFFTNYENADLAKLIEKATTSASESERVDLFSQIQRMAMADPPFVPLVFTPATAAVSSDVHGFDYVLTNWFRLDQVSYIPKG